MHVPELFEGVLPCPHCESSAFVANYTTYYKTRCTNGACGACGGSASTIQGAKDLWNCRTSPRFYQEYKDVCWMLLTGDIAKAFEMGREIEKELMDVAIQKENKTRA